MVGAGVTDLQGLNGVDLAGFDVLLEMLNRRNVTSFEGGGLKIQLIPAGPGFPEAKGAPAVAKGSEDEDDVTFWSAT
jgi:hypothetical protein